MTGQNRHHWPDLFYQGTFFEVLGKGVAREPPPIKISGYASGVGLII